MALASPVGFDAQALRSEVRDMYTRVAESPEGAYHFHRGPEYAAAYLDYDVDELATLPDAATASFAGVGNPLDIHPIAPGETVLDVGCGAGTDLLLAAQRVGRDGHVIGIDMTPAMIVSCLQSAVDSSLGNVSLEVGDAESLPVDDESVDAVISNGVLNLTTDKRAAFREILRVLRPGGRLQLADIVVDDELPEGVRNDIDLWAS